MRYLLLLHIIFFSVWLNAQTYEIEEMKLVASVKKVEGINLESMDFSPVVMGSKMYFTSSRQFNKNNLGEDNWNKSGYLNVFVGDIVKGDNKSVNVKNVALLSNRLNAGTHTGPISFTAKGDTLFFTRVIEVNGEEGKAFKSQLFMTSKIQGKWKKIKRLPFSKSNASYGHPAYDANSKRIYFTSDRKGGKGGNDIYYVAIGTEGKWGEPVNLEVVNTEFDEKFPFVTGNNVFFSSNRDDGEGQLDIYYQAIDEAPYPLKIEGLNSAFDDFGIWLNPDLSEGYFSSNRNGNDNIFHLRLERKMTVRSQLAGVFTFRKLSGSPSDLNVQLYNGNGDFVYEEKTDESGNFLFDNINVDSNFSVRLNNPQPDNLSLQFFDQNGQQIADFLLNETGAFKYKRLFYEEHGIAQFIPDDMKEFELNTAELSGKVVLDAVQNIGLANEKVYLMDTTGAVVFTQITDESGNFSFKNLDLNNQYYLQLPNCTDDIILYIYAKDENIFTQLKCNGKNKFLYRRLKPNNGQPLQLMKAESDTIFLLNTADISGKFSGIGEKNNPISCVVRIYNEDGVLLGETTTDSKGNFTFNNLSSASTYKFTAETNIPVNLSLFNRYGKEIAQLQEEEENYFIFRPLGYKTDSKLSVMDNAMTFDMDLSDQYDPVVVYFASDNEKVMRADLKKLNKLAEILTRYPKLKLSVSAYADATASSQYNFILSQKRGEWITAYLVKKGIDKNRLTVNAYGENQLIDPEDDAVNRRAELRIYK